MTGDLRPRIRAAAACAALLLAALAAACGSSATSASSAPVSGGTLVYTADQLPDCLDPAVSAEDVTAVVDREIFDSLVSESADGVVHPWLASSWDVSPSGTVYTFHLRSGVLFQDGTPLDAAAVKASLDHVVARATASEYAASLLGPYTGTTVVDPDTVRITLSKPFEPLLQALSTPFLGIQSARALQAAGQSRLCSNPVGSGPFSLVSWTKPTKLVLKNNPAYAWGPADAAHRGAAYLAGVTFQFDTVDASRFGALTSGQSDVVQDVPPVDVKTLRAEQNLGLLDVQQPGGVYMVAVNTAKGPAADPKVREALLRSVDLDQLVRSVYFGQYARAWSPLSPTTADYEPALVNTWPYDPALANQLLDQAGWTGRDAAGHRTKDGQALVLRWPASVPRQDRAALAQGIQAEAGRVGIGIDYVSEDEGSYLKDLVSGHLDLVDTSFVRAEPDILRHFFASDQTIMKGGANEFGLNVPQLDQWLDGATATTDAAARRTDYSDAQKYLVQNAVVMPVYVPTTLVGYRTKVHGLTLDADGQPVFSGAWIAK